MDTPGIGGSGEVTQKLMEYIPNAVSFIFVINVSSAGGMQRDRVTLFILLLHIYNFLFSCEETCIRTFQKKIAFKMFAPIMQTLILKSIFKGNIMLSIYFHLKLVIFFHRIPFN